MIKLLKYSDTTDKIRSHGYKSDRKTNKSRGKRKSFQDEQILEKEILIGNKIGPKLSKKSLQIRKTWPLVPVNRKFILFSTRLRSICNYQRILWITEFPVKILLFAGRAKFKIKMNIQRIGEAALISLISFAKELLAG
jgi:hypothetical protein